MSRVLVVDPVRLRREGVAALLRALPIVSGVEVAAPDEAPDGVAREPRPDVVLLGAPSECGAPVLARIRAASPGARVIALGVAGTEADGTGCADCWGYVPADCTLEELEDALHAASVPGRPAESNGPRPAAAPAAPRLTAREQEILSLLALGLSNKQISRRLAIRVLTVKNHVHNILDKLGVGRRGEAVARMRLLCHESRGRSRSLC